MRIKLIKFEYIGSDGFRFP